jgi:hypothetical protein
MLDTTRFPALSSKPRALQELIMLMLVRDWFSS